MSPLRIDFRTLRENAGLSQAQLAEAVGVRQATISALETGKARRVDLDTLDRIARALSADVCDLLKHERSKKRQ